MRFHLTKGENLFMLQNGTLLAIQAQEELTWPSRNNLLRVSLCMGRGSEALIGLKSKSMLLDAMMKVIVLFRLKLLQVYAMEDHATSIMSPSCPGHTRIV